MKKFSAVDVLKLSVAERIQLVEDVWDSIAKVPDAVTLTEEQKEYLDAQLEKHHKDPSSGSPWVEVKKRILSKK